MQQTIDLSHTQSLELRWEGVCLYIRSSAQYFKIYSKSQGIKTFDHNMPQHHIWIDTCKDKHVFLL